MDCGRFFNREITVRSKGDKTRVIPMTVAMYDLLGAEHGNDPLSGFHLHCQEATTESAAR